MSRPPLFLDLGLRVDALSLASFTVLLLTRIIHLTRDPWDVRTGSG